MLRVLPKDWLSKVTTIKRIKEFSTTSIESLFWDFKDNEYDMVRLDKKKVENERPTTTLVRTETSSTFKPSSRMSGSKKGESK